MADYFTHFSCLLDVGTPENAAHALDLYTASPRLAHRRNRHPRASSSRSSPSMAARSSGCATTSPAIPSA
jgi:hypothetical protein